MSGRTDEVQGDTTFLLGAPRSGTSLLYKLLCLHRQVAYVSNWVRRFPTFPQLAVLNRIAKLSTPSRRLAWFGYDGNAYVYGSRRPLFTRFFPMPVEGEPVFTRCGIDRQGRNATEEQRNCLRHTVRVVTKAAGGSHFISKRIANNRRIGLLHDVFPGARFVWIIRDGRAVADSLSKVDWWNNEVVWWYGDTPARWRQEGGDPWEMCARHWVEEVRAIESGLAAIAPVNILRVRYENLVEQPMLELRNVAGFLGLAPDSRWAREVAKIDVAGKPSQRLDRMSREAQVTVTRVQADLLAELGYEIRDPDDQ